ncbi:Stress responsive A/B barrel domain protein [Pseudozyma hubeiensis]|nr:Stress responsive A/B barrel domain protein [Pseudozyma hubeiensis]
MLSYDQLQQSQRRNANLQEELAMSRLVAPDALAYFSAVLAKQITNGTYHNDSYRQNDPARFVRTSAVKILLSAMLLIQLQSDWSCSNSMNCLVSVIRGLQRLLYHCSHKHVKLQRSSLSM